MARDFSCLTFGIYVGDKLSRGKETYLAGGRNTDMLDLLTLECSLINGSRLHAYFAVLLSPVYRDRGNWVWAMMVL